MSISRTHFRHSAIELCNRGKSKDGIGAFHIMNSPPGIIGPNSAHIAIGAFATPFHAAHETEESTMAATIIELIVAFLYPLILSAIAWIIFKSAITGRDGISEVVEALIPTNGLEKRAQRATGLSKNITGERPINEKTTSRQ